MQLTCRQEGHVNTTGRSGVRKVTSIQLTCDRKVTSIQLARLASGRSRQHNWPGWRQENNHFNTVWRATGRSRQCSWPGSRKATSIQFGGRLEGHVNVAGQATGKSRQYSLAGDWKVTSM